MTERRAHERAEDDWTRTARASLRPGCPIAILNISCGGALIEAARPLRPGTRAMLQIATPRGPVGLSALVLRCAVSFVSADAGVLYRAALRFDDRGWSRDLRTFAR